MFAAAFMFLAGAVAAVVIAQLSGSRVAPWLSIGYSAGAVLCTFGALLRRSRP